MQNKKHKRFFASAIAVMCSLMLIASSGITGFAAEKKDAREVTSVAQTVPEVTEPAAQRQTEETTAASEERTEPATEETTVEVTEPAAEASAKEAEEELSAAPASPNVTLSNAADGIKLQWDSVDNANQYLVCGTEAGKNSWKKYNIEKTEFVFGGVESGKQYYFQVQAILNDGTKTAFSSPRGMTFIAVPKLNAVVNNFETNKTLKLSWSAVKGANKYRVARMKSGDTEYEYFDTYKNLFVDKKVEDNNTYRYQVRAMYSTQNSGTAYGWWSVSSSAKISVWPEVSLQNVNGGVKVSWNSVKNTARYFVYCKKPSDSAWTRVVTTNLSHTFTGLKSGQVYYFQLYSDSISGKDGKFSKAKSIMYIAPPKQNTAVYNSDSNTVTVSWKKVTGAAKYQIARLVSGEKSYTYIFVNGTSYTDKKIKKGKFYTYQVRAVSADDIYGFWSDGAVGESFVKPEVTMSNTASGVKASWNKIGNASSYIIYYKEASDSGWKSKKLTDTSFLAGDAKPGKLYFFQLRYIGKGGGVSPFSDVKSITFTKQGTLLSLRTSGNSAVYLRWAQLSGADYYVIEKTNITTGKKGHIAVENRLDYTDTGIVSDNTYSYRVCGVHRETEWHKVYENAAGAYSGAIKINPRAFNVVNIGLSQQGQKGYKYCNEINKGKLDEWCAIFAGWVLKQGGYILNEVGYHANVGNWCDNLSSMGKFSVKEKYTPEMGDLIIFGRANFRSHIGIVVSVGNGYVTTVEGNAAVPSSYSGSWMANSYVTKREYELDNSYIYGYGIISK